MAIPLIVNGVTFQYPQQGDKNWGPTLTNWSSAVTSGMLQKAGGTFTLTSEVDFGSGFGMKVLSIKSEESNIAASGFLRLGNASTGIVWRNAANSADLALTVNASNQLTFNGINVGATTSLTNGHILVGNASNQPADVAMSGDITISNTGATTIGAGKISDSNIASGAAIAMNKLAALATDKLVITNSLGVLTYENSPTLAEVDRLAGVTSPIQTQLNTLTSTFANYLPLAGGTMTGVLNMGSHKISSVTPATNSGEALAYGQAIVGSSVLSGDGTTTAPSHTFTNESTLGMLRIPSGTLTVSAPAASWNTSTNIVTAANHNLQYALPVRLTTTGTLPSGLALATTYYVIVLTKDTFALASSVANAGAGTKVAFVTQGVGTHTLTDQSGAYPSGVALASNGGLISLADNLGYTHLFVGGFPYADAQIGEMLTVYGNLAASTGGAQDILNFNSSDCVARFVAIGGQGGSYPILTYMASGGRGNTGTPLWTGGPSQDKCSYFQNQNAQTFAICGVSGVVTSRDQYWQSYNVDTQWHFIGNETTEVFNIQMGKVLANVPLQVGGSSIASTAIVDVQSTTKGFLPPRMTTTQRNAISSPAEGLMVYDLTLRHPFYYNGTTWVQI